MPSKQKIKAQRAVRKEIFVFKWPDTKVWFVYVNGEYFPREIGSKRAAINLAYAISIAKKNPPLEIFCYTKD